ncbi:MAG: hypothetical protein IAA25_02620 [Candidatus Ruminococcus intestinipullorum]|nr:hypothetical protein [Candidatus Ruminococcus intestinipullorum]
MKKTSKLLKGMSIVYLILGVLNLISSVFSLLMKDSIESTLQSMGMSVPTISYILTLIGAIIMIVAGILGIMHKSKQSILYAVVILLVYYLGIFIYNTLSIGLAPLNLLSFLLPLLYTWGWYQSED